MASLSPRQPSLGPGHLFRHFVRRSTELFIEPLENFGLQAGQHTDAFTP
jgi:predicted DNA-binding protein with PD1-like motif